MIPKTNNPALRRRGVGYSKIVRLGGELLQNKPPFPAVQAPREARKILAGEGRVLALDPRILLEVAP